MPSRPKPVRPKVTQGKAKQSKKGDARTPSPPGASDEVYEVVLRAGDGSELRAKVMDRVLYPKAVAWNRLLLSDQGRQTDQDREAKAWRSNGHKAIMELAEAGEVSRKDAEAFIKTASASGVIQVEMTWKNENIGWASHVFPWEALLAFATKDERKRIGQTSFIVVRVLKGGQDAGPVSNPPCFVVTEGAEAAGFDFKSEQAAINQALQSTVQMLHVDSIPELLRKVGKKQPRIVHLLLPSAENGVAIAAKEVRDSAENQAENQAKIKSEQLVAKAVAAHGPDIVVFSSCYTGRRLAPLAVAYGAKIAMGFHGEVLEPSIPVFFGAFYRAWTHDANALHALAAALEANRSLANPGDLGTVTLWSNSDLIGKSAEQPVAFLGPQPAREACTPTPDDLARSEQVIKPEDSEPFLPVICELEEALNYSVLHNSRGGLFKNFVVTKIRAGRMEPLEVSVRLDTGFERPAACHFFVKLPVEADRQEDLAAHVTLPLGSQLLRQRGESMLGTVEIVIRCGTTQVFHKLQSIKLLPCDEWRDDETGRHLLPSFVFPRDPAVREIVTASQSFLRALSDSPLASFDGYQNSDPAGVTLQARAVWAALQYNWRLDYVNPPPTYTKASQRLRIPEEILRARRGTCIELALLLASCWEHVGIFPVIFLTTGHAFAGYWTSDANRARFIDGLADLLEHASEGAQDAGLLSFKGNRARKAKEPWMLAERHHLAAIRQQVLGGQLVPLEATYIPLQQSFAAATVESATLLAVLDHREFDGMLDVQTAREKGVTPLAVITEKIVG